MRGRRGRGRGRASGGWCPLPPRRIAVIAEKPKAAEKIASAIGDARKCSVNGVPYWVVRVDGGWAVVAPSAGHLFGPHSDRSGYPVLEFEWRPLWEFERGSRHLAKFYNMLRRVVPGAYLYVNACDYDIEGSVIGYLIIERLGDPRRARRMKFSSLAPAELRAAFRRLQPLDVEMVEAGMARHELDWLWGINVSRALMDAFRRASGRRVILSAGRVQSPTLVEAVRRWRVINTHVPEPRFSVWLEAEAGGVVFRATNYGWAPGTRGEAAEAAAGLRRAGRVMVAAASYTTQEARPPPAFNLGDLQAEAARLYGFSPSKTQEIAEELYLDALISYPRTNSQKLPPTIDYASIIRSLSASPEYGGLARSLLAETRGVLRPVQGRKDDPAHPAIHPTGKLPDRPLPRDHARVYDLVVRRFLAAFAGPARLQRGRVVLRDGGGRGYAASGVAVLVEGWMKYYPYLKPREARLPRLRPGAWVRVVRAGYKTSMTAPSTRLTRMELLKWMESVNIGTEGTRARIIETLFKRGYLASRGGRVEVTDLGEAVADTITELFPDLSTPGLTRRFEELIEAIRRGEASRRQVVEEARRVIVELIEGFKARAAVVGRGLAVAAGLEEPETPCLVCGRQAEAGPVPLCKRHRAAARRLREALPRIAARLGVSPLEALRKVASSGAAGAWVAEVAKAALRDEGLLSYLLAVEDE